MVQLTGTPSKPPSAPLPLLSRGQAAPSQSYRPRSKHPWDTFTAVLRSSANLKPGWRAWSILLGTPRGIHTLVLDVLRSAQRSAHKVLLCSRHTFIMRQGPSIPVIHTSAKSCLHALALLKADECMPCTSQGATVQLTEPLRSKICSRPMLLEAHAV